MLIAIDGPAGAGKSTAARAVAEAIGGTYLDSGAMYRCVALVVLRAEVDPDQASEVERLARESTIDPGPPVLLDGEDVTAQIRSAEVSEAASRVSVHPGVREAMVARQRELIANGVWVAEGRDIGTIVAPDAELKIFLTAAGEERARRRALESGASTERVAQEIAERDRRDRERDHGALIVAEDAIELDTSDATPEQVASEIVGLARERGLL